MVIVWFQLLFLKKPKSIPQYLLIAYFLKRICKTKMLDFRNKDARWKKFQGSWKPIYIQRCLKFMFLSFNLLKCHIYRKQQNNKKKSWHDVEHFFFNNLNRKLGKFNDFFLLKNCVLQKCKFFNSMNFIFWGGKECVLASYFFLFDHEI